MRHYPSWIAGLAYEAPDGTNRAAYCAGLRKGDVLDLVPKPRNKFDPNAVALYHQGHHVGYVPSKHHWVSASLASATRSKAKITAVALDGAGGADRVALKITVAADGDEDYLEDDSSPKFTNREPSELMDGRKTKPVARPKRRRLALLLLLVMLSGIGGGLIYASKRADGLQARDALIEKTRESFAQPRPDNTVEDAGLGRRTLRLSSPRMTDVAAKSFFASMPKTPREIGFEAVEFTNGAGGTWHYGLADGS